MTAKTCPTRYRSTCYGISTTSGKLGFIGLQIALSYIDVTYTTSSGITILPLIALSLACLALFVYGSGLMTTFLNPKDAKRQTPRKGIPVGSASTLLRTEGVSLFHVIMHARRRSRAWLSSFFWPEVKAGYTRVQWKCVSSSTRSHPSSGMRWHWASYLVL